MTGKAESALLEMLRKSAGACTETGVTVFASFVSESVRALGLREEDVIAWFWIGTHEEYNHFHF